MSRFNELLEFCARYSYIYCYGAGKIGLKTTEFLYKYGIKITGYIVSSKNESSLRGIDIWQIDEIAPLLGNETGIILSLDEKFHEEILQRFIALGIERRKDFFSITYKDIVAKINVDLAEGATSFYNCKRDEAERLEGFFEKISGFELSKKNEFEEKYLHLKDRYKKIVFGKYYMRHIGEMCLTYYLWCIENERENNILYVMLPVYWNNDEKKIPNFYFMKKIQEKIEFITYETYEFWRWVFQVHLDEIEVSNKYDWTEIKHRDMNYLEVTKKLFPVVLDAREIEILDQMNLKDDFVCIYNRDEAYYKSQGMDERTEEYRHISEARNTSVSDYGLMASEYQRKGIKLVRMGHKVAEKIETEGIIDYASKFRTEKLDFYLISKCKFFIVTGSGIMLIAKLFNTPLVVVDSTVISFAGDMVTPMSPKRDLILMKKLWFSSQNRYLTLDEILYMEGRFQSYELFTAYNDLEIEFQSNSPEELLEAAEEMRARLEERFVDTYEDECLQKRYWNILHRNIDESKNHYYNGRFSTSFLRKNRWFLEDIPEEMSIRNILPK